MTNVNKEYRAAVEMIDDVSVARARALGVTLDYSNLPSIGSALPELWHWILFWPLTATNELGPDGHPKKRGVLPDLGLPRRMWAGGRLKFHSAIEIGQVIRRSSTVTNVEEKSGRTGRLGFVTVRHLLKIGNSVVIEEEQDIVYREAYVPGAAVPQPTRAPTEYLWKREIAPTETMLFRYSALTFNSHRIHYDREYALHQEGYPNLVVHGPFVATLLLDLVRRKAPESVVKTFTFKAVRPTFLGNSFTVCGQPSSDGKTIELWAKDNEGWLTMRAQAEVGGLRELNRDTFKGNHDADNS